jgi:hypothetical protein
MPKRAGSSLYFNSPSRFPWFFSVPSSRTSNGSFPPSCFRSLGQAYSSEQVLKPGFAAQRIESGLNPNLRHREFAYAKRFFQGLKRILLIVQSRE